ncbi:MAG: RNA polymerase sporulation sigma factor SigK [Eubacteriales bacterium]|nr:RNA polymerase sporulation sigma factor SigK [Eubacteriales bacterium]
MKTFQKPLTAQEEKEYLDRFQAGDQNARDILIERNMRLVAHVVKKYQGLDEDLDDLISVGTIGLIKAVSTFDASKSVRLSTYAARCIDNELLMLLRQRKKKSREVSLYDPIGTDKEGNEISLLDIIETIPFDVVEHYATNEDILLLSRFLNSSLSDKEYEVIKLRYGLFGEEELTQREIAKRLNISRSYVSRIEKNALLKLRQCFLAAK